jgi:diguanylate cyclase (GGDEF)-like protein
MPGPVWTMALWFAAIGMVLLISLAVPMNARADPALRAGLMVYAFVSLISVLVMRARTPGWYLHLQVALAVLCALWLIWASVTPEGVVTSSMSLIIVAIYTAFWFELRVALWFAGLSSVGLLLVLVFAPDDYYPALVVPWVLVSVICFGLVLTIGTLMRRLNQQLVTDPLTGLLNRTGLYQAIDAGADELRAPRAVVVIDLDRFKDVNDREGHLAGDRALAAFAADLVSVVRDGDLAVRSGGDEFTVVLPGTSLDDVGTILDRLRQRTRTEWSWGAATWSPAEDFDVALARADQAMYRQKAGRAH